MRFRMLHLLVFLTAASPLAATPLEIEAKLVKATPTPEPARIAPYPRALCTYLYDVTKVRSGSYPETRILVVKWTVWDRKKLPGPTAKPGTSETLRLVPWSDHPEFERDRIMDDVAELDLVIYYDPSTKPDAPR